MKYSPLSLALVVFVTLCVTACSSDSGGSESSADAPGVFDDRVEFRVRIEFPVGWRRDPDYELRFSGSDGYVSIVAQDGPGGLKGVADAIAHHKLQPYGSQPEIEAITVDGANGLVIRPSADQHADLKGQVALVLERESPLIVSGENYSYLIIEVDGAHFAQVISTISLYD